MSNKPTEILTPVGRLIMGDCFEGQTTDADGNPLLIKNGPNAGQPRTSFYVGVAIPKTDPTWAALYETIYNEARVGFPTLFDPTTGACLKPDFAFKIIDGDSNVPNTKGIAPCTRENFPGNWILNFSNGFAPKCFDENIAPIVDPAQIKRGCYVRVSGTVKANGSMQQPGIYLNHAMVQRVFHGEEITSGPDGQQVFGGAAVGAMPAGASATPLAPVAGLPAQTPATPAMATPTPAVPATPAAPVPGNVAPAPDILTPAAPAAPVTMYLHEGKQYTRDQLVGWSDAQIATLQVV